ncbi:hypothetical protein RND71_017784 [Anisodus tanguticus]|uniref:Uncharacterized protein n=1 Tax=Anisodus tanguticus TaxID=243964 RepID=A0AAE1VAB5_9SOLA|nr:hypothetical protein RND71_017784 [Anisodus tanguticus]
MRRKEDKVKRTKEEERAEEKKKGRTTTYDEVVEENDLKNKKDGHRTWVEPHVEKSYKKTDDTLKGILYTIRKEGQKPNWMLEGIWARLNEKWAAEEFHETSIQAKAARPSDNGHSLHIGGSEKKKGRTTIYDKVVEENHVKNKKDGYGTWVEPHVEKTYRREETYRRAEEFSDVIEKRNEPDMNERNPRAKPPI